MTRPLAFGLAAAGAVTTSLVTAARCDAHDVLQVFALFALPPLAGILSGAAVLELRPPRKRRPFAAVVVAVVIAVASLFVALVVWFGRCSS